MTREEETLAMRADAAWLFTDQERAAVRRRRTAARRARTGSIPGGAVLSAPELIGLTNRERPSAQARVLERLHIPHRRRPDGSLIVFRCHVQTTATADAIVRREPQLVF